MLFPTFIGTISYNCRDNQNKVSYHGWGQGKKNTQKRLQSVKKLLSEKNEKNKPVKWFVSQIEWLFLYDAGQMTGFCDFLEKTLSSISFHFFD